MILGIVLVTLSLLSFLLAAVFLLLSIENRRENVNMGRQEIGHNPTHLLFHPELLTDKGKRYRKLFFICWLSFFALVAFGAVAHYLK